MVRTMPWKFALIAIGTLASFVSQAERTIADDSEGIVRICDRAPGTPAASGSVSGCPSCQPGRPCQSHCQTGNRYGGVYGYYGNGNGGYYGYGCMRPCGHVHQFLDWFNPHGMCVHSPDHGYAPPGKMHTPHPQQVAYTKGFPDALTGRAGGAVGGPRPVAIYMPTDTTQLGYYYQAAPRWQANPRMVPPTPVPSQWHRDLCQGQAGGCRSCRGQGAGNCPHCKGGNHGTPVDSGEQIIEGNVIEAQPQAAEPQPAPMIDAPVNPPAEPAPVNPAPEAAPLEKAANPDLQPVN